MDKDNIIGNEKLWRDKSSQEQEAYAKRVFEYYRSNGFPYYPTDMEYRRKKFEQLINYDKQIITDDIVRQTMHGLALAWSYFPHAFDVRCNGKKTALEVFNDDQLFMKVIHKRMKYGTYMGDSGILKMLKMFTNTQAVSNFRPTAAFAIYERFASGGVVWDMSSGWGGRLLGAIKSSVKKYYGTDPSTKTHAGLLNLANDFGINTDIELYNIPSEDQDFIKEEVDLCFTSPPYYDTELYADEETQSYKRYTTYADWLVGYMKGTINRCYDSLKPNGILALNIADTKKYKLTEDSIKICNENGFKLIDELKYALSNPKFGSTNFKYEPIYIFRKV